MKLSVLVPGIRTKNWRKLYDSVIESFSGSWEMVIISPYKLPDELKGNQNIKIIEDWGSPMRCQQRGLTQAEGDYVTWAADDGVYLPGMLDKSFEYLDRCEYGCDDAKLVMGKYTEGDGNTGHMMNGDYYILNNHNASNCWFVPDNTWMLNVGVVPTKLLMEVGGWDCQFEVCPMAYNDLAIRLQRHGVRFIIQDEIMYKCTHLPGHEGDHAPIHDAMIEHDMPLFKEIYDKIESRERIFIEWDNWEQSPERWVRRFGE